MKFKKAYPTNLLKITSVALLLAGAVPVASAQLYAYEPFDYAVGSDLVGASGGLGWTSPWGAYSGTPTATAFTAVSGSLSAAGLTTIGNSAVMTGADGTLQLARSIANISGADGTTTWFSYIGQRLGTTSGTTPDNLYPRGVNIGLFDTEATANPLPRPERIALGNSSNAGINEWSLIPEGGSGNRVGAGAAYPFSDLYWAVLRIDHHGDATVADDAYLFLNPDPNSEPALGSALVSIIGAFDYSRVDFIRPFIGGTSGAISFGVLAVDEIRIGGDYASMTATTVVPEPTSLVLFGLGGMAMMLRRKTSR